MFMVKLRTAVPLEKTTIDGRRKRGYSNILTFI
jgi:hypothetical protein